MINMMINFLFFFMLLTTCMVIYWQIEKDSLAIFSASPFFIFTIYWFICFPLRAFIYNNYDVQLQAHRILQKDFLLSSLFLSFLFWFLIFLGYAHSKSKSKSKSKSLFVFSQKRSNSLIVLSIFGIAWFIFKMDIDWLNLSNYTFDNQFVLREGNGLFFLIPVLFIPILINHISGLVVGRENNKFLLIYFFIFLFLSIFIMIILQSRRVIYLFVYISCMYLYLRDKKYYILLMFLIFCSIFMSPIFNYIRYFPHFSHDYTIGNIIYQSLDFGNFFSIINNTFEGVDHVASFLEKISLNQFFFGVDHGVSWSYNMILAYVPRFIWYSKPIIYGTIEQQYFLYPELFNNDYATITLPPSFVVDYLYGFGVIIASFLCYLTGFIFFKLYYLAINLRNSVFHVGIYIYLYIYMFNFVRSGTSVILGVLVLSVIFFIVNFNYKKFINNK